jgi:hypothetical protein
VRRVLGDGAVQVHFAKEPIKKREGPPLSVYRYGAVLRPSLEMGFVDGALWSPPNTGN